MKPKLRYFLIYLSSLGASILGCPWNISLGRVDATSLSFVRPSLIKKVWTFRP